MAHSTKAVASTGLCSVMENGRGFEALRLFQEMCLQGEQLDRVAFVTAIDSCRTIRDSEQGRRIHETLSGTRLEFDLWIQNTLLSMYGKCHRIVEAKQLFDSMKNRDLVSWNSMVSAFAQNGHFEEALELYDEMETRDLRPDSITFISALDACAGVGDVARGREIHSKLRAQFLEVDITASTILMNMYGKSGSLMDAKAVFDDMKHRDLVSWNTMMNVYLQCGHPRHAVGLFKIMDVSGVVPNTVTFITALEACSSLEGAGLREGRLIHSSAVQAGLNLELFAENSLLNMYAKCGSLNDAERVFESTRGSRSVVTWTSMISAYARLGHPHMGIMLFKRMQHEGVEIDKLTYLSVADAYAGLAALEEGRSLHVRIVLEGLDLSTVMGNTLVSMYGRCGSPEDAKDMFDKMISRDLVTWNAMLGAFTQNGRYKDAVDLFHSMVLKPDKVTMVMVLDACAGSSAGTTGRAIHTQMPTEIEEDLAVQNALVHMYGKCGSLSDAKRVFDEMLNRNVVSWTSLIAAFAQNGFMRESLRLVEAMDLEGVAPNEVTFVAVLCCCSHAGKLKDGWRHFVSMQQDHGILPGMIHYGCMVDLLGRSGKLAEAEELITSMPCEKDVVHWSSLLAACVARSDDERGERCAREIVKLKARDSTPYIMLSKIYAGLEEWEEVGKVKAKVERLGANRRKQDGFSWIEVDGKVHEFTTGKSCHSQKYAIHEEIRRWRKEMRNNGYQRDKGLHHPVLSTNEEDSEMLDHHSEKLALAFGLLATPAGGIVRLVKSSRICSDCHSTFKFCSLLEKRRIVVQEGKNRFHHFENGICSCGDFW